MNGKNNDAVYVIILNYENWKDTVECLKSVSISAYKNYQIIVIDNNSQNDSIKEICKAAESIEFKNGTDNSSVRIVDREKVKAGFCLGDDFFTLIQSDHNGGFAYGNNLALKAIKEKSGYFFLLNPDMQVDENTIEYFITTQSKYENSKSIFTCSIYDYFNNNKFLYSGLAKVNTFSGTMTELKDPMAEADYVCGGALFAPIKVLREVGLLPEDYFLYWEDADWCYQAKKKGYSLVSIKNAKAFDKGGTTIGRSYLAEYYYVRNSLKFLEKYKFSIWQVILLNFTLKIFKKLMFLKFKRAKAIFDATLDFLTGNYKNRSIAKP